MFSHSLDSWGACRLSLTSFSDNPDDFHDKPSSLVSLSVTQREQPYEEGGYFLELSDEPLKNIQNQKLLNVETEESLFRTDGLVKTIEHSNPFGEDKLKKKKRFPRGV